MTSEDAEQVVEDDADPGQRVLDLEEEIEDLEDRLARARAEQANLRKRLDREVERARAAGERSLLGELVPVLEDLERAAEGEPDPDGVRLVRDRLREVLERAGVEPIEAEGSTFDPKYHEAVARVPADDRDPGTVVEVVQPGYLVGDDVLRHSRVTVASSTSEEE